MRSKKALTLQEKEAIIQSSQAGESTHSIAKRIGRDRKVIRRVLENQNKIRGALQNGLNPRLKRLKKPKFSDVDMALFNWFKNMRSQNMILSGDLMKVRIFKKCKIEFYKMGVQNMYVEKLYKMFFQGVGKDVAKGGRGDRPLPGRRLGKY